MAAQDRSEGARARPLFCVAHDDALPPFPGEPEDVGSARPPSLAALLGMLLEAVQCHVIPAPAAVPDEPSITDAFIALEKASQSFDVAHGLSLADYFWTHAASYRRGDVAAKLLAAERAGEPAQAFLALYATDVRSPLVYTAQGSPVRVKQGIDLPPGVSGPFLVLIVCCLVGDGRVEARSGYAQPIYHARRFVPVASDLERDVLQALERLQEVVDAYGCEMELVRELPRGGAGGPPAIIVSLRAIGKPGKVVRLIVNETGEVGLAPGDGAYVVTDANWSDGTFIAWLEEVLIR